MELIVGNFPSVATMRDLAMFFASFEDEADFEIVELEKVDAIPIRFGLVSIPSERNALKAIRRLNGKRLAGAVVTVREYVHRAYSNDRRAVNWRNRPWHSVERRRHDRRHAEQKTETDTVTTRPDDITHQLRA